MRDHETERLLWEVRRAVVAARLNGVSAKACIFDATVAAVDSSVRVFPSEEARRAAVRACRAVDAPEPVPDPAPRPQPVRGLRRWFSKTSLRGFN
jgi:hypothetical protein